MQAIEQIIRESSVTQLRNLAQNLNVNISDLKQKPGYKRLLRKRLLKEVRNEIES